MDHNYCHALLHFQLPLENAMRIYEGYTMKKRKRKNISMTKQDGESTVQDDRE